MDNQNQEIRKIYDELHDILSQFMMSKGGKNKQAKEINLDKRERLISRAELLMQSNHAIIEIMNDTPSITSHLDQGFFTNRYFESDMSEFLNRMREKYNL